MSQDEVLRMVARLKDEATSPARKIFDTIRGLGREGTKHAREMSHGFKGVHEQLGRVAEVAKTAVGPAIEVIGVTSLSAVGVVAALVKGLKDFAAQGEDVAAFGRKVQLSIETVRGFEGVAEKFHVDPAELRAGEQNFVQNAYLIRRHRGELYAKLLMQRREYASALANTPDTVEGNEKALDLFLELLDKLKKEGKPDQVLRMFSKEATGTDAWVDILHKGKTALDELRASYLKLAGPLHAEAGEHWAENWSDFKSSIEGIRNAIGADLLPNLTELTKQATEFVRVNQKSISREVVAVVREVGSGLRALAGAWPEVKEGIKGIDSGVQTIGGWKVVLGALAAYKFAQVATGIFSIVRALGAFAAIGSPPAWILAILGLSALSIKHAGSKREGPYYLRMAQLRDQISRLEENAERKRLAGDETGAAATLAKRDALAAEMARTRAELNNLPVERSPISLRRPPGRTPKGAAEVLAALRARGLDEAHAAILAGNIQQESGFDPTRPNLAEGGIGLIQWRLERRTALQRLAAARGKVETDAGVQLEHLMNELHNTPAGNAFLSARDPYEMNSWLHRFIGYGDKSEGLRLAYGTRLLNAKPREPGSLLARPGAGAIAPPSTIEGSATLKVDVTAPRGTRVEASGEGLFKKTEVRRGFSMAEAP